MHLFSLLPRCLQRVPPQRFRLTYISGANDISWCAPPNQCCSPLLRRVLSSVVVDGYVYHASSPRDVYCLQAKFVTGSRDQETVVLSRSIPGISTRGVEALMAPANIIAARVIHRYISQGCTSKFGVFFLSYGGARPGRPLPKLCANQSARDPPCGGSCCAGPCLVHVSLLSFSRRHSAAVKCNLMLCDVLNEYA